MTKPIVFLSHSSRDDKLLKKLKELLVSYTGGAIDFFLSSDGQSIPLGRNWVHELQQALDSSQLMFVFISPNSLNSSWLYFEAGYAYSKRIKVVPVGIHGVDLSDVPPPLSLLQGFNIKSEASLNNILAVLNGQFDHQHRESFSKKEYDDLFRESSLLPTAVFVPRHTGLIDRIEARFSAPDVNALSAMEALLNAQGIPNTRGNRQLSAFGLQLQIGSESSEHDVVLALSGSLPAEVLPAIADWMAEILYGPDSELELVVFLNSHVELQAGRHNITAKLFGTEVTIGSGEGLLYRDFLFELDNTFSPTSAFTRGSPYIRIKARPKLLARLELDALISLLPRERSLGPIRLVPSLSLVICGQDCGRRFGQVQILRKLGRLVQDQSSVVRTNELGSQDRNS